MMNFYQSLMGSAFVYDRVRPMLLGGFDFSEVYGWLAARDDDVVFDIGCGTGQALEYLTKFRSFHGFDLDASALEHLRRKYPDDRVHTENRRVSEEDVARWTPSKVVLMGILHHLSETDVVRLFEVLRMGKSVERVITLDPVYRDGHALNNVLGWLDRGRHVRTEDGYLDVIGCSEFRVRESTELRSGNGVARYFASCLVPGAPST